MISAAQPVEFQVNSLEEGFQPMFNGYSLEGWEGDSVYWSVRQQMIVGTVTEETLLKENSFLIWRDGTPADFELKLEVWISERGNSGINYRSSELSGKPFRLKGYQMDIDGANQWSGQNYEERGRRFLAYRGQVVMLTEANPPVVVARVGDFDTLAQIIPHEAWNTYHIIAQGTTLIHVINGRVMSVVIDQDRQASAKKGLIGVQVHVGPPMEVRFRNIRIKDLRTQP